MDPTNDILAGPPAPPTMGLTDDLLAPSGPPDYIRIKNEARAASHNPALRQQMLASINAPIQSTVSVTPINPFNEPGKWLSQTWHNMMDPVREDWNLNKWYGKPLAAITAPLQVIGAPVTGAVTAMGYKKASSGLDVGMQYAADPATSTPVAMGAVGLGLATDFLNPANWAELGEGPLAKEATETLKSPVATSMLRDAKQAEDVARVSRHGTDMTDDFIRKVAAPTILAKSYKNTFDPVKTDLEGLSLGKTPGDPGIFENVWGGGRTQKNLRGRSYSYDDMLNEYRSSQNLKDLQANHSSFPRELVLDQSVPLDKKLEALAKHQVYIEKAIKDQQAATRVYGFHVAPSPLKLASQLTSRLFGRWRSVEAYATPLKNLVTEEQAYSINKFFNARGMTGDWSAATPAQIFQALEQVQNPMYSKGGLSGAITDIDKLPKWVLNEVKAVPQEYRLSHLVSIENIYRLIRDVLKKEPRGITPINAARVERALKYISGWRNAIQKFMESAHEAAGAQPPGIAGDIYNAVMDDTVVPFMRTKRLNNVNELLSEIEEATTQHRINLEQAAPPIQMPVESGIPPAALTAAEKKERRELTAEFLARATALGNISFKKTELDNMGEPIDEELGRVFELPNLMKKLVREYSMLLDSRTPYPYSAEWRQMKMDTNNMLKNIHDSLNSSQEFIRDGFLRPNADNPVDGTLILSKLLSMPKQAAFWQNMEKDLQLRLSDVDQILGTGFETNKLPEEGYAKIRAAVLNNIINHQKEGRLTTEEAETAKDYFKNLSNKGISNVAYVMTSLAKAKAKGSLQAALLETIIEPFKRPLENIMKIILTEHDVEFREIMSDLDQYQAYYEPYKFTNWLMKTNGPIDRLNKVVSSAFIKAGFSPLLPDILRQLTQEVDQIRPRAQKYGLQTVSRENVLAPLRDIDPVKFATVSPSIEEKVNNAVGDVLPFWHTPERVQHLIAAQAKSGENGDLFKLATLQGELNVANQRVASGKAILEKIIGKENVDRYLHKAEDNLSKLNDLEYAQEHKLSIAGVFRKNYHPYYLSGDDRDKDILKDLMQGLNAGAPLPFQDFSQISTTFGHAERRVFPDAASVQAFIDTINKNPAFYSLDHPLDVRVGSNISAAYAIRKSNQLRAIINRAALAKVKASLPGNMVMLNLTDPGQDAVKSAYKWTSLKDLIPSMGHYYVPEPLYNYISNFIPAHRQADEVWSMFHRVNNWLARMMVKYSFSHIKNIAALTTISGVDVDEVYNILKYAFQNRNKYSKEFPVLERMAMALDEHPMYQESVRNGITHFRGADQFKSPDELIEDSMKSSRARWYQYIAGDRNPIQTLTFGILDKAIKTSLYKEMISKGLSPTMAADWTNHFLIDYSAKNLNPKLKRLGHALFPFFGWRIGNALLHIPNALENPGKYILLNYIRDYMSDSLFHSNPYPREYVPEALTEAIFLPMRYSTGQQVLAFPDLPQDPWFKLTRRVFQNPTNPLAMRAELANFLISRSRVGELIYDAIENRNRIDKESFWDNLVGTPKRPGYIQNLTWGVQGPARIMEDIYFRKDLWQNLGPDIMTMFMRMAPLSAGGKAGRLLTY